MGLWYSSCQSVVNLAFDYDADGVRELQRLVWAEQTLATLTKKYPQIYDKDLEHVLTKAHCEQMYCPGSEALTATMGLLAGCLACHASH